MIFCINCSASAGIKDPLTATSYGTGELLKHALDLGVEHIILGLGGSATNDGGAGLLQAIICEKLVKACSSWITASGEAPFCGEKTILAPLGPMKGEATMEEKALSIRS